MINKNSEPGNDKNLEEPVKNIAKITCHTLKNTDYKKKEIIKEDGRYLIYYDFKKNKN
jgi:hypothetical protein